MSQRIKIYILCLSFLYRLRYVADTSCMFISVLPFFHSWAHVALRVVWEISTLTHESFRTAPDEQQTLLPALSLAAGRLQLCP